LSVYALCEGDVRDTANLSFRISHLVETFALTRERPVRRRAFAARLTPVDVAVQLAHDEHFRARNSLAAQQPQTGQVRWHSHALQRREQTRFASQAEDRVLRAQRRFQVVVLWITDRAEQHGVAVLASSSVGSGSGWPDSANTRLHPLALP
jgi:hypothetical protein